LREFFEESTQAGACLLCGDANTYPDKEGDQTAWKALRSTPRTACVWDEYYDPFGTPRKPPEQMPVTSNKMRGPLSDQPAKIGEHVFHTVDHIFFSAGDLQFERMAFSPLCFPSKDEATLHLLPSHQIPSDHAPVMADLCFRKRVASLDDSKIAQRVPHHHRFSCAIVTRLRSMLAWPRTGGRAYQKDGP
jgi:hypothetical protein